MSTPNFGPFDPVKIGQATALVSLVGSAIQQTLQLADAAVSAGIDGLKTKKGTFPGGLAEADFKKCVMVSLSFLLGLLVVWLLPPLRLLSYLTILDVNRTTTVLNVIISALIFSAGTEGANTVLKYFGYIKDARKESLEVLDITPKATTISKGGTVQFSVSAKNGRDSSVRWGVLTGGGASISSTGLFTAPNATGTFHVAAVSTVNPSDVAVATVTVT